MKTDGTEGYKRCRKCNEEKALQEFYKNRATCKKCNSEQSKKWREKNKEKIKSNYEENKEEIRAQQKRYYEENKEKIALYKRRWCEANKEEIVKKKKRYYEENKEKIKQYYEENKEKISVYKKLYRQANLEKVTEQHTRSREKNEEKVRERERLCSSRRRAQQSATQVENITATLLTEYWEEQGIVPDRCYYCKDGPYEHLEHCVPLVRGGKHIKENLVPSCAKCNLTKGTKTLDEWNSHTDKQLTKG